MANERVLIVDDSSEIVDFLTEHVLTPNGYQAFAAPDGTAGLQMALNQTPDLLVLEMNVPKLSGPELLEALHAKSVRIPTIMMTSDNAASLTAKLLRRGVKDCVQKPIEAAEMVEAIDRALTESRLRRAHSRATHQLTEAMQELEQRQKELNTLFGIGKSVTSLLDQDKLLSRLVEAAIYLTGAEEGSMLLVDETSNELYMAAARGIDERIVRSFRQKVSDSLAGQVVTTGQPLMLTSEELTKIKTEYLVRSLIYVPLKVKGQVSGILGVNNRQQQRDFTNHDLRMLAALADYAVLALENSRLSNQADSERIKLSFVLGEIEEPVVLVAGQNDEILEANAAFKETFGLSAAQVAGQPIAELLPNSALPEFVAVTPEAGSTRKTEITLGDGRTFRATLIPISNLGKGVVMQDVTLLKELEQLKSDFVAAVSHDLRAPLTSMQEYADMLGTVGELNEKQQLFVSRISKGMADTAALIDSLLDLSTIETGIDPEVETVDLGQLATHVVADFQTLAGRKRQQLICHAGTGQPALVTGNELRLRQVVGNLIDNAIKYTPEEGQISVIVLVEGNQVVFKVEDNGPGIPPADLPLVFDKFFRAKSKPRAGTTGIGLGLAICKSIVEKYGGHIWAESQPSQGSVFIFKLPLAAKDSDNSANPQAVKAEALAT